MKQKLLVSLALFAAVVLAHWPALSADLVWDDTALVLRDPFIRSWRQLPEQFQHYLFTDATPSNFYRPVQRATYTLDYALGVFRPWVYHLSSVLIHGAAAIAFFFFALALLEFFRVKIRSRLPLAGLTALGWALHPLHSGVIDYVAGRADSLAALFGFFALTFALRSFSDETTRALWKYDLPVGGCLLLSALSKESGLTFAAGVLVLGLTRTKWRILRRRLIVDAFVLTIYLTLRAQAGEVSLPQLSKPAPALVRPIIAARAFAAYARLIIAPTTLHMERDVESHPWGLAPDSLEATSREELGTIAGVILLLGATWWMWHCRKHQPAVLMPLALAALTYLPIAGFWPLNATMAEHWIYVPSAFLLLALAAQLAPFLENPGWRRVAVGLASIWISALGARSFVRAGDWHDQRTFFERTIAAGGNSERMLINLGNVEMSDGHLEAAKSLFERALQKNPEQPFALINLAALSLHQKDYVVAHRWLERAQKNEVTAASAHEMLAILEYKEKAHVDLMRLRLAAHMAPPSWPIERRYIQTLAESGHYGRAIDELKSVLQTESYRAESWQMLAVYLARTGNGRGAVAALTQAADLDVHLIEHGSL